MALSLSLASCEQLSKRSKTVSACDGWQIDGTEIPHLQRRDDGQDNFILNLTVVCVSDRQLELEK